MTERREVPFFRPAIGDEEIAEVVDSLRNGWITTGQKTRQFESDFADFIGGGVEALAVNSATAGLHLALEAIGIGPGDEVIVPDYTFTASAEVIRYLGAKPVFADMEFATLNIDPASLPALITPNTKAIMVVHFAGLPVRMTEIMAFARKHNLRVIEDAAHALPAKHDNRMIGALDTDASIFSFYANKTITTGEGGMIVTRDAEIAKRCRVMRLHGIDRDAFDRFNTNSRGWEYDVVAPGYKYNMSDIAGSIGLQQLKKADALHARRTHLASLYDQYLAQAPLVLPAHAAEGQVHSWHLYIIRLNEQALLGRDELMAGLDERRIKCSVHYTPLHRLSYWRDTYNLRNEDFPNAEKSFANCVSLPLFPTMQDDDVRYVADQILNLLSINSSPSA